MNPDDVQIDVFGNASPWPMGIHTMIARHRPSGAWIEGNWADGENTETNMREELLDKLSDMVDDLVNG